MKKVFSDAIRARFLEEVPGLLPGFKKLAKSALGVRSYAHWCFAKKLPRGGIVFLLGETHPRQDWYTISFGWSRSGSMGPEENRLAGWELWLKSVGDSDAFRPDEACFQLDGDEDNSSFWHIDNIAARIASDLSADERGAVLSEPDAAERAKRLYRETFPADDNPPYVAEAWVRRMADGLRFPKPSPALVEKVIDYTCPRMLRRIQDEAIPILRSLEERAHTGR